MAPGTTRNNTRTGTRRAPRGNLVEGPSQPISEEFEILDSASETTDSPATTPGTHIVNLTPKSAVDAHTVASAAASLDPVQSLSASVSLDPVLSLPATQIPSTSTPAQSTDTTSPDLPLVSSGSPSQSRPGSPDSFSSSSSDSSSSFYIIMTTSSPAPWVNNGAGHLPTINSRHLEPLALFNVFSCVDGYYINKEITDTDSKKARNAFFSCFTAPGSVHFFAANRTSLLSLDSADYKHAIHKHILGDNWESDVHSRIFSTKQASVEDKSFEVLQNTIGAYNSMLQGTPSAVDDVGLQGAFYSSFTPEFALRR
ncbi:hypothetical protein K435DRAFT_861737 [Dendrothele bispora CBS 962.96]|uniref:Uncharacterized protein n=1 Tax=Dendrothele bispora (strain CBS 962.96) TaxID=1314807 RepID=A0A4S8LUF7_DENBC|nr:hypothetical protein K435DRAFT_861737 [Dendrothele bispora CBS 962.96]